MPGMRGRKRKLPHLNKQNKVIPRLMEISLKVDDYVYKNKPICQNDARMYLNEISSYEELCLGDVRSLQVIEKLIRYMKSIITEQKENGDITSLEATNTRTDSVSPVYSITDEDRSQLTQELRMENPNLSEVNVNQIDILDEKDSYEGKHNCHNNSGLVNDENEVTNTELTMHRAISNLSIKDTEDLTPTSPNMVVTLECSQSIIQNVITNTSFEDINIENKNNALPTLKLDAKGSNDIDTKNNCSINAKNKSEIKKETCKTGDIKKKKDIKKPRPKKTLTILKENKQSKKASTNQITIPNKKNKINKDVAEPIDLNNEGIKHINKDEIVRNSNNTVNSKSLATIYNNAIEDDLSWIENIRYVREVTTNEYDPGLNLSDSFWNNYSLPDHWNDEDFDY